MNIEHAYYTVILEQLDKHIKDPEDEEYKVIRRTLERRLQCRESINPFGAGAPRTYGDDITEQVVDLRRQGKSYRAIAEDLGIPKSTVERIDKRSDY